jgi:hypothetical protein
MIRLERFRRTLLVLRRCVLSPVGRRWAAAVASALVASVVVLAVRPAASAVDPVRIMPLGDSITGSPGCWRALLWNRLQNGRPDQHRLRGNPGAAGLRRCRTTGTGRVHGGALVTAVADQNQLPGWLAATRPHIVADALRHQRRLERPARST